MISLKEYISNDSEKCVNEGFFMNALTKRTMKNMDSKELYTGILNMYDYIIDNDDIKMFYKDFPVKERLFWKNLYELYTNKVWSIFDVEGDSEVLKEILPTHGQLLDITPEFRRKLRQLIKDSSNSNLDIKPSDPKFVMKVYDKQLKKHYVFTINRATGIKGMFRAIDAKFLEEIFNKIGINSSNN